MGPSGWTLLALALLAALAVAVQAVRHPILARMGARNALRRPRQTATVVAGLMVGTAIISAALVAGDSAGYAIRGYVYQSLGVIDESVSLEGYPFFPEAAYDHFLEDPEVDSRFDGIAAHVIWDAAVESPRTGLFEPLTFLAGYDLERDAAFGDFELVGGGSSDGRSLERGDAIVTSHLAEQLEARVGDRLNVTFTPPLDPLLPEVAFLNGTLAAAVQPSPLSPTLKPVSATHAVEVTPGATRLVLAVAWVPGPATSPAPPTLSAAAPDGTRYSSSGPSSGAAPGRTLLNVTAPPDATLQDGNWTVTVASSVALQQAYVGAAVVLTPVYDLAELRDRARALERQYGDLVEELDVLSPSSPPVERSFRVAAITDGGRGDVFDFRDALFLRLDEAQDMLGREGQVNLIKFSNPGGPASGVHGTDEAMKTLNASLERLQREHPDSAALQNLETRALKETYLKTADETGQTLTGLLVFAGSLSIITGLLLIVNIFTMLAEERRGELGMARAVGMSRADLVRLFLIEGSLYAVVAAFLGALLGLALAAGMVAVMNAIVSGLAADVSFPPIAYRPSAGAVLVAFSVGALLTFATIFFASRRASRLNVVRAIRRIEEPDRTGRLLPSLLAGLPLIAAGLAALALGWV
ncbi:MAG TPA: FtsX-like permease family protein, partial [Candidatus Thermoplasmatota archaeon]|nr:FtsX-like permease family protein [Candidatus Thermoplasmatota archaeon]